MPVGEQTRSFKIDSKIQICVSLVPVVLIVEENSEYKRKNLVENQHTDSC